MCVQLVVGLSFFIEPEAKNLYVVEEAPIYDEPAFTEFCTKFFDLDGHERMSKLKLFKVSWVQLQRAGGDHVCRCALPCWTSKSVP